MTILTWKSIGLILQSADIEGFIASGAPKDEYDVEAKAIANALSALPENEQTEDNILAIVITVWQNFFELSQQEIKKREPALRKIAQNLLQ